VRADYWILDDAGEPVPVDDVMVWAQWFEEARRTRANIIAQDRDERRGNEPEVLVSTVFLGLDHNLFGVGPPILWETMILGGPLDGYQRRYSTRAAALEGHAVACDLQRQQRRIPKALFSDPLPHFGEGPRHLTRERDFDEPWRDRVGAIKDPARLLAQNLVDD